MITVLPDYSLKSYISSYSLEDKKQSYTLWHKYASRSGVIDLKGYSYDASSMSYVDKRSGRHIPNRQITLDTLRLAQGMRDEQRALTQKAINQTISQQEWYEENLRLMKLSYLASIDVASGTQKEDNNSETLLALLLLLFMRFNKLAQGIDLGQIKLDKSILTRVGMYGLNNKTVYENRRLQIAKRNGYSECRRIPGPNEHCQDGIRPGCDELIRQGWMDISKMVPLGETTCLSNCQCSLQFRNKSFSISNAPVIGNKSHFVRVRDSYGKLLFMYDASSNSIQIKHKWHSFPVLVDLSQYKK